MSETELRPFVGLRKSAVQVTHQLFHGDCIEVLRSMPENSVDSIVTDPPYGLSFMGKKWDYDVPSIEVWAECLRVLKPGGYLLAFAGTRTQHRMCCRIEDAGFEIRDMIAWVYGSGFPKSLDVSKAIDGKLTTGRSDSLALREVNETRPGEATVRQKSQNGHAGFVGSGDVGPSIKRDTPATEAARQWQGWGTALKPALEPITVARKPLIGTVAANVLAHGTGALNIDGCRVEHVTVGDGNLALNPHLRSHINGGNGGNVIAHESERRVVTPNQSGRWPANLIHDGSDEVLALFPANAGAAAPVHRRNADKFRNSYGAFAGNIDEEGSTFHADQGSAARFFYCAKASRADRNAGCEEFEEKPLHWSKGDQNPGSFQSDGTHKAATNNHPTVKPTDLMRYLCRLVTPAGGTVLDPFMGSGSTGRGAILEKLNFIGIDRESEYVEIARARVADAERQALR